MCVTDCKDLDQIKLFSLRSIFALYTKSEYQNNITKLRIKNLTIGKMAEFMLNFSLWPI